LDLEPFGSHWSPLYGENAVMFSSKTLILDDMGVSKLSAKVFYLFIYLFFKWTTPLI